MKQKNNNFKESNKVKSGGNVQYLRKKERKKLDS